ncbi:hypothetical protein V2J09_019670 [Rumex salicifolius]
MALKKPSNRSTISSRNGKAAVKLKKPLRRRFILSKAAIKKMVVRKELIKQVHKLLHSVNSLAGLQSTSGSSPNQAEPSGLRRLHLHFVSKLPTKLFTASTVYAIADETEANTTLPVKVLLLDENNHVVNDGPLSSLKVEICVACGNSNAEESEARLVVARQEIGSLLVGNCIKAMENGVCSFNDLKFIDNSSWMPSKMFRLVAKVAYSAQLSSSIGIKYNEKLEAARIFTVKDFLQKYYSDESSLKRVLGVKNGVWETIVQHATKCVPNGEYFQYNSEDQEQDGVGLLFNCFYKLIAVSFDHQNYQSFENLTEYDKWRAEQVRRRAFEHENKLVQINYPLNWPSHQDQTVQENEAMLHNCPSYPQSPLLQDLDQEEMATQRIAGMKDICSILRSNTLLRDTLIMDSENHPLYNPDFIADADYMFDEEQGLNCRPEVRKAVRVWYRARVTVLWFLSNKTRIW